MPDSGPKIAINLNLLKPQSDNPKALIKLFNYVGIVGRYIVVFVNLIVIAAVLFRFKLDMDIARTQEAIDNQIPYLEDLKDEEIAIRQTQFQIATIKNINSNRPEFKVILEHLTAQVPTTISLITLNVENAFPKEVVIINGQAPSNAEVGAFVQGLKEDGLFGEVTLTNIGIEDNTLKFSITAVVKDIKSAV